MVEQYRFSAPIERSGNGAYVTVQFRRRAVFGKKRVPVRATIDGIAYRGSLVRMGGQRHVLGVLKEIRSALGKDEGDVVEVVIEHDLAPRVVDVPADFAAAHGVGAAGGPRIRGARLQSPARVCPLD